MESSSETGSKCQSCQSKSFHCRLARTADSFLDRYKASRTPLKYIWLFLCWFTGQIAIKCIFPAPPRFIVGLLLGAGLFSGIVALDRFALDRPDVEIKYFMDLCLIFSGLFIALDLIRNNLMVYYSARVNRMAVEAEARGEEFKPPCPD